MVSLYDTHAHVHDAAFDEDREAMLARARERGVTRLLSVGTDVEDSRRALAVAARYGLAASIGIHPHEARHAPEDIAGTFDALRAESAVSPSAIGEIGLDYHHNHSSHEEQLRALGAQLAYARAAGLPVIFHQRDAFADFVRVLEREFTADMRGVVHCFTGTSEEALVFTRRFGLKLGIGGVATFKTATALQQAVREVPLDTLILETDCPYLAPVPNRGKRNEPAFMSDTASFVANLRGISVDELAATTTATACALFGAAEPRTSVSAS